MDKKSKWYVKSFENMYVIDTPLKHCKVENIVLMNADYEDVKIFETYFTGMTPMELTEYLHKTEFSNESLKEIFITLNNKVLIPRKSNTVPFECIQITELRSNKSRKLLERLKNVPRPVEVKNNLSSRSANELFAYWNTVDNAFYAALDEIDEIDRQKELKYLENDYNEILRKQGQ